MKLAAKHALFTAIILVTATAVLVGAAELLAFATRKVLRLQSYSVFVTTFAELSACEKMVFDPHLGHAHRNDGSCKIRDGYTKESFVYYLQPELRSDSNVRIVTLGGSTTDGFFQHVSDGFTWPLLLSKLCNAQHKDGCDVINGGNGGYSSSKEYMKLVRDVVRLRPKPDIVISLNGINDFLGYDATPEDHLIHPMFDKFQLSMLNTKTFPVMDQTRVFLPNIYYSLKDLSQLGASESKKSVQIPGMLRDEMYFNSIPKTSYAHSWEVWKDNVEMMHNFSMSIGIKYYVFLQPTMGLTGRAPPPPGTSDAALYSQMDKEYLATVNAAFDGMKRECERLPFCFDFTGRAPATGDVYADPRHHNSKGNGILAQEIYAAISEQIAAIRR